MKKFARLLAAGGGAGYAPVAPGTVASLLAIVVAAALGRLSPWAVPALAVLALAAGAWALHTLRPEGDPGWVVVDEFAGQWVALLALPQARPLGLLAAFLLFRLFDITKPGPVGWADRKRGAFGIMADDVLAGALAALLLLAGRAALPGVLD